jgi:hypothetical protein
MRVTVGVNAVTNIEENEPHNGNQLWNFIITYECGKQSRIFNPNYVEYSNEDDA